MSPVEQYFVYLLYAALAIGAYILLVNYIRSRWN